MQHVQQYGGDTQKVSLQHSLVKPRTPAAVWSVQVLGAHYVRSCAPQLLIAHPHRKCTRDENPPAGRALVCMW
jgi:hypothetical protein